MKYFVLVQDLATKEIQTVECENNTDLGNFLVNIDSVKFKVINIASCTGEVKPYLDFVKKDEKLETGGNQT